MAPSAPASALPSSYIHKNFSIRRRESTDLVALIPLLATVHAHDTYPVEGPNPPSSFLTPANELISFVAVRHVSSPLQNHSNSAEGEIQEMVLGEKEEIIGHALLTSLSAESNLYRAYTAHCSTQYPPSVGTETKAASLGRLFTHPSCRSLGAGRELIDTALDWAREKGLRVLLNVMNKDVRAIELYGRLGWENVGQGVYQTEEGREWEEVYFLAPL